VGGQTYAFQEGDFRFFRKNQLCKFEKQPPPGGEFISLSVRMDKITLQHMSQELGLHPDAMYKGDNILKLEPTELLKSFVESVKPYLKAGESIDPMLTELKVKEVVMLLLKTNPQLKNVLFDFAEPGKIDLEAFMTQNYKYNVDINRFAYLTGRSLATFKRDFEKAFHTSPNRWLQQKRLDDAHYLIKEKGWRSSDVYMEVGFKDLSHFSFAFKKAFGVAPSRL
jgi:AraC-like DNA-binding protein